MADDMLVSVGAKADFSSLKTESKAAADALRQAEENMKQAFAELGQAAEQGSAQAIAALKQYETELAQAQARATAAEKAVEALGGAHKRIVPEVAAASAAIRELEGKLPIRAVERFLSNTLGLGPALQAAFPVLGAIAFGEVILQMGESLVKFGNEASELSSELGTSWMDAAILKMEGLDKAIKSADESILRTEQHIDEIIAREKEDQLKRLGEQYGAGAEASQRGTMARDEATRLEAMLPVLRERLQLARAIADAMRPGYQFTPISPEQGDLAKQHGLSLDSDVAREQAKETEKSIEEITRKIESLRQRAQDFALDTMKHEEPKGKSAGSLQSKADEERMRADELAFNRLRIDHEMTLQEEQRFWRERLSHYAANTSQYAQIVARLAGLAHQEREALQKGDDAARHSYVAQVIQDAKDQQKAEQDTLKSLEKDAEARTADADAAIEAAEKVALANVDYDLATGAIDAQTAAHRRAEIQVKAYADRIDALRAELQDLIILQDLGLDTGGEQSQVKRKITGLEGDKDAASVKGATKEAKQVSDVWKGAFKEIGREFASVQSQMLRGQISLGTGAKRIAADMANDAILSAEKSLARILKAKALEVGAHWAAEAGKTTATATNAVTRDVIEEKSSLKAKFRDAKDAAHGAFASTVHIPVVGPIIAPIAAAGAFAAVMAFEQGGIVSGPMGSAVPIVAHAGERVLSASQTNTFERLVNGGGAGGGTTNQFGGNTFNGVADKATFQKMLHTFQRDIAKEVVRAKRNGHFRMA